MKTNFKKSQKGFTIIEVLIVLAIAGLILLIVFLAVPALQRNSRNTQVRNDVAAVLGMISEFQTNNNGSLPTAVCSDTAGNVNMISTGTCAASATARVGQVNGSTSVSSGTTMPTATATIVVALNRGCTGTDFSTGTSNRVIAAGYRAETSNGSTPQCQQS